MTMVHTFHGVDVVVVGLTHSRTIDNDRVEVGGAMSIELPSIVGSGGSGRDRQGSKMMISQRQQHNECAAIDSITVGGSSTGWIDDMAGFVVGFLRGVACRGRSVAAI